MDERFFIFKREVTVSGKPKRYDPASTELKLAAAWQRDGVYRFNPQSDRPVYSVDTPPATVSGSLHLGHVYSYSHADFMARFWRMQGRNVFYPMGFDDNGLPTERLVEKRLGIKAAQLGRSAFIQKCLEISETVEQDYRALWTRLGLSVDWRFTYRTIDAYSRRTSQFSFIDLYNKGRIYQKDAPAIWCPECRTAIAQAELDDLDRMSEYVTLPFEWLDSERPSLRIATTRPELLAACVAVFVHPNDPRYTGLAGRQVRVPLFGQQVPVLEDAAADPEKGTGAVMCCTFGDSTDVAWWRTYGLPMVAAIGQDGRMTEAAGAYNGLPVAEARTRIKADLQAGGLILERQATEQTLRVHERCDTPVETIFTRQWFVRVLDAKQELLEAGEQIQWHPEHMRARYRAWVENLNWDWCISRQRYFGVRFPLWYCQACGEIRLARRDSLPVDPLEQQPDQPCRCGSTSFRPETDVMDTWATSSMTPQIVGRWLEDPADASSGLYEQVFPFSLRPQAHEIIRTWAFYTIAKSKFHFNRLPWKEVLISGWGIAGQGMGKISKSKGGGPIPPLEMIERYSADAVRYWAASTGTGKDAVISEEKIQMGARLVNKLWNVAQFSARFLDDFQPEGRRPELSPADRWILARAQSLIRRTTEWYQRYDYAAAKNEIETFFWGQLADNYLEMSKQRLYATQEEAGQGARYSLYHSLQVVLKLLAPLLPFVTDEIYTDLFPAENQTGTIHTSSWPKPDPELEDERAEALGEHLVAIATAVRRYKSERNLALGRELTRLQLAAVKHKDGSSAELIAWLEQARADLMSITRSRQIDIVPALDREHEIIPVNERLFLQIEA
jgi:valyl-tRNA synthetase